jgi:hypothetical protein
VTARFGAAVRGGSAVTTRAKDELLIVRSDGSMFSSVVEGFCLECFRARAEGLEGCSRPDCPRDSSGEQALVAAPLPVTEVAHDDHVDSAASVSAPEPDRDSPGWFVGNQSVGRLVSPEISQCCLWVLTYPVERDSH